MTLRELLVDPPHGLYRQSWAPRMQRHGTVNADGFGVGWYADGDPVPARVPADRPDLGRPVVRRPGPGDAQRRAARRGAVDATAGTAPSAAAAPPFAAGRWLFSHNGAVAGWPGTAAGLAAHAARCRPARPGRARPTRRCCGRWSSTGSGRRRRPDDALADA